MTDVGELHLLPPVKELVRGEGSFSFKNETVVAVDADPIGGAWSIAMRLRETLSGALGVRVTVLAGPGVVSPDIILTIGSDLPDVSGEQGYTLRIEHDRIAVHAVSNQGLHHGVATLAQIVDVGSREVPCLEILDWPDFDVRGILLDISRDRVPTMDTLFRLVDEFASWKVNQLQLYTEHTFAYRRHPEVWANASPITAEEMVMLDAYCRDRYIELVPCQSTFGHMHRWLRHPRYAHLAETDVIEPTAVWGPYPFSLAAVDPESVELVRSMYDELLPCFTSSLVNACLDESDDGGTGRSTTARNERGAGTVYLEFVTKLHEDLASRDRRMLMWADRLAAYPDLIPELPRGVTPLVWGYIGSDEPFATQGALFADAGLPFYVCPGTWSFGTLAGATDRALANMAGAARHGTRLGATGYLTTDWGWFQHGTIQTLPISRFWLGVGAAHAWAGTDASSANVPRVMGLRVLGDRTGTAGSVVSEIGNLYQRFPIGALNMSFLFVALREPIESLVALGDVPEAVLCETLEDLEGLAERLALVEFGSNDSDLVKRELQLTMHLLAHACHRSLLAHAHRSAPDPQWLHADLANLTSEFVGVWLARFRSGGLAGTIARFGRLDEDYRERTV
ncbi:MAG: hypothetical protein BMS9Abin12_0884 [Acidimicrobiia bacterium]|nr:MAG: hypothetical protein BMS9Abin12_0884 [Acidimicrobiia bacterium]